jgi:hypothetical protein
MSRIRLEFTADGRALRHLLTKKENIFVQTKQTLGENSKQLGIVFCTVEFLKIHSQKHVLFLKRFFKIRTASTRKPQGSAKYFFKTRILLKQIRTSEDNLLDSVYSSVFVDVFFLLSFCFLFLGEE